MWCWKRQSFTENSLEITLAHSSSLCRSWPWRPLDAMVWDRLFPCSFVILVPCPLSLHIIFLVQLSSCFLRYLWPPLLLFLPRGGRRCPSNRIKKSFEESAQQFWPLVPSKYHQRLLDSVASGGPWYVAEIPKFTAWSLKKVTLEPH